MTSGSLQTVPQIFGEFIDEFAPDRDSLELTFTPTSRPIKQRWRNNRVSAHFVADYLSSFIPVDEEDASSEKRIKQSKGAVSYIANELLENAIKFTDENSNYKVNFGIHFLGKFDVIAVIFATNCVQEPVAKKLQEFIAKVLNSDSNELYLQQLEKNAECEGETSGLGLLTMINDYSAKIGWKFEAMPDRPNLLCITTLVQISV
ncbi:DUF6272 family protein [Microcoleus sp. bin38.metabat.b11b12b14.051]|uniref:DUF6272 family protein n=1 Tax=Microcoleus sp. bin38.metabat.b11b12b14.051 TaxID=2742709 RepID=UPI0025D7F262|nr:DUF6272 family protein [Microcoleus sp. bin38.metabat.b11b12b14.051]